MKPDVVGMIPSAGADHNSALHAAPNLNPNAITPLGSGSVLSRAASFLKGILNPNCSLLLEEGFKGTEAFSQKEAAVRVKSASPEGRR